MKHRGEKKLSFQSPCKSSLHFLRNDIPGDFHSGCLEHSCPCVYMSGMQASSLYPGTARMSCTSPVFQLDAGGRVERCSWLWGMAHRALGATQRLPGGGRGEAAPGQVGAQGPASHPAPAWPQQAVSSCFLGFLFCCS